MPGVLLDTNVWSWSLAGNQDVTRAAQAAISSATDRYLSPISVYEVTQKVRLGKWPEMAASVPNLITTAERQGLRWASLSVEVCRLAGSLSWVHRDPFDRIIAATAMIYDIPVISSDRAFDGIVTRIW